MVRDPYPYLDPVVGGSTDTGSVWKRNGPRLSGRGVLVARGFRPGRTTDVRVWGSVEREQEPGGQWNARRSLLRLFLVHATKNDYTY